MAKIVVTGSSSGIGFETARLLRAEGIQVIGIDRVTPETPDSLFVQADLSNAAGVEQAVARIREVSGGSINGLANIAGVPGTAPTSVVQGVNVFGMRDLTRGLATIIASGGSIVNLASAVAYRWRSNIDAVARFSLADTLEDALELTSEIPAIEEDSYLFSKCCVRFLTEYQAAVLQEAGIRSNSVSPGPVETPILNDFKSDHGRDKVEGTTKLVGRFGQPDDIASVVARLLSDELAWVNGTDIRVDGGLTAIRETAPHLGT